MKVSIITPSFNQGQYLERTIHSVLEQDYPDVEYIIIDGGSTDYSQEIIKRYRTQLHRWVSEPDQGQTDAINKGFGMANGEILAWLNSDDTYQPGAITQAVRALQEHPEIAGVYANANFIDEQDRIIGRFPAAQTNYRRLRNGYVHIPQQTFFFRANLWRKVGPLDPSFNFAMDYDLWVRLMKLAPLLYVHGQIWANFRLHPHSKTILSDVECWPEMLRVHYREGGSRISAIAFKYQIRKMVAPLLRLHREAMFR